MRNFSVLPNERRNMLIGSESRIISAKVHDWIAALFITALLDTASGGFFIPLTWIKRRINSWMTTSIKASEPHFFLVINYPLSEMGLNSACLWHPTKSSREIMLSLESAFAGSLVEWVNAVAIFLQLFPHFHFSHLEAVTSGCSVLGHMRAQQESLGCSGCICCPNNCSSLPLRKIQWADRYFAGQMGLMGHKLEQSDQNMYLI